MTDQQLFKGWGELRPAEKVAHFYVAGTSLCNKVGFFRGELTKEAPADKCPVCEKHQALLDAMPSKKAPNTQAKAPAKPKATTTKKATK